MKRNWIIIQTLVALAMLGAVAILIIQAELRLRTNEALFVNLGLPIQVVEHRPGGAETVSPYRSVSVAPIDPNRIDALVRQHEALRQELAVSVAPTDPNRIDALVRQHEALRERVSIAVAPTDPNRIDALVRQQAGE